MPTRARWVAVTSTARDLGVAATGSPLPYRPPPHRAIEAAIQRTQTPMRLLLLASAGGALGAGARYLVNVGFLRWLGPGFPWATLTENVAGSALMGFLLEMITRRFDGSTELRSFLLTGILGGFTTFSAFSLDFAQLIERGQPAAAFGYLAASVGISISALYVGFALARAVLS